MLKFLLVVLVGCAIFYTGIVVGVKDCKKHYNISKENENLKVDKSTDNT